MELFLHQKEAVNFFQRNNGLAAFYHDMGTGKTLSALKCFEYIKKNVNSSIRFLVVCPLSIIESSWIEDIKKFTTFSYENMRKTQFINKDIMLINYEMLLSTKFREVLRNLCACQLMCVLDESQKIKSYNAKVTKVLLQAAPSFPYKIVMSGTPAPNIESEYWSQMKFLSPNILGDNYFKFRNRYMGLIRGRTVVPLYSLGKREMMMMLQRGYIMDMLPGARTELKNRMKPFCQYVAKRDVLDLPDEIDVNRFVDMTPAQTKAYKEMHDDLVTEINSQEISVNIALAKLSKLREITSGFIYNQQGEAVEIG